MNDMERNEKGKGTVYQKGSQWVARLRYTDELHNSREKSFLCDSKQEAEKKLKDFKESLLKGEINPGKPMTLGEWLETAMKTIYKAKLNTSTYALYQGFIDHHLEPLSKVPLSKLTPSMCDNIISSLKRVERVYEKDSEGKPIVTIKREKPLSGQSKTLVRRFLIGSLNHAVRVGYLKDNPAERSLTPLKLIEEVEPLSPEEVKKLLGAIDNILYKTMFCFQILLGLRIAEVCGIKWEDLEEVPETTGVDPIDGQEVTIPAFTRLHIKQQVQRDRLEKKVIAKKLKTSKSNRVLILPEELVSLLSQIERRGEFVFSTTEGTPIEPRNAQRALESYTKKAQIRRITTHNLRKTAGSLHHRAGTPLGVISAMLGHSDIRTTMIYVKSSQAANREANDRLRRLLDA